MCFIISEKEREFMQENKWLLTFKKNPQARTRLIAFHHSGGGASAYFPWVKHLSPSVELIALQLPGREGRFQEPLLNRVEDIIHYVSKEFALYTDKPFFIFGHSLGALLSFEFAKSIQKTYSVSPHYIIVSASKAPHLPLRRKSFSQLGASSLKAELTLYGGISQEIIENEDLFDIFCPILKNDFSIAENYNYRKSEPLLCNMLALSGSQDQSVQEEEIVAWAQHIQGHFTHISFPGDHFFLKQHQPKILEIINHIGENYPLKV